MTEQPSTVRHGFLITLAFSPYDPDVFATAALDSTVRLWSLSGGTKLVSLQGPLDQVWVLTFANISRYFADAREGRENRRVECACALT